MFVIIIIIIIIITVYAGQAGQVCVQTEIRRNSMGTRIPLTM